MKSDCLPLRPVILPVLLCSLLVACSGLHAQTDSSFLITTVAGNGLQGFSGDGGPATAASLHEPHSVAVDAAGNVYIADYGNVRIRRVTPAGIITTVAGNGTAGFSGDGGPATAASLSFPSDVAVDASGNLYIAQSYNSRVRKVTPAGIITTVAGNGVQGFSGDGGPATAAWLNQPDGVAVDASGNLYIADTFNRRVRKVTPAGIITTVAGNGASGFSGDGGPATAASLLEPHSVAVDTAGNVYIADQHNNGIRKVTPAGIITTVAGYGTAGFSGDGGPATAASLSQPHGMAVDTAGNLYIADFDNNRIRKVTPAGIITTVAGSGVRGFSGDGGPATAASLNQPDGVAVDASGNLYIADRLNYRIRKLILGPSTVGCMYSIDQEYKTFGTDGGRSSVAVLTNQAGCPWIAISTAGWVTITSGSSGSGNGIVTYSVEPNGNSTARTGTLWIAGKTFTVTQAGLTCSYSINPNSVSVPSSGVIGSVVSVTSNAPDCSWTPRSNVGWVLLTSGTNGTGNGTVSYTVGINTGGFRTGTITIAGQTFTVNQAPAGGAPPVISMDGVVNAASGIGGPLAPGEFVSIYGVGVGPAQPVPSKSLGKGLGYTRVFFNGIEAFLTYTSAGQVNALVPYGIAGSDRAESQVEYQAMKSSSVFLPVAEAAPGVFTQQYGVGQAWVVNQDQTFNSDKNPAERGSYVAFWATGQGPVNPPGQDGDMIVAPSFPKPKLPVAVSIGGVKADIAFAGLIYTGVMQVNVRVPDNAPVGNSVQLLLMLGDSTSRSGVTLAVR